jgi:hypothetical protein
MRVISSRRRLFMSLRNWRFRIQDILDAVQLISGYKVIIVLE